MRSLRSWAVALMAEWLPHCPKCRRPSGWIYKDMGYYVMCMEPDCTFRTTTVPMRKDAIAEWRRLQPEGEMT